MKRNNIQRGVSIALLLSCLSITAQAQKLVFAMRHAERDDDGAAVTQENPPLSARGEARAAKLADMLQSAGISAIYATEYRRTRETAIPLAKKLNLPIRQVGADDTAALLERLRREHARDIVLLIGHSGSIPRIIKALGGPDLKIADDEYDNLYVVVPATGTTARIRFVP
jgi:broad specificity phosphatase PhoE